MNAIGHNQPKRELFIIEPGLYTAASPSEITATVEALHRLKAYALPYPTVTVRIRGDEILTVKNAPPDAYDHNEAALDDFHKPKSKFLYLDVTISDVAGTKPTIIAYNTISGIRLDITDRLAPTAERQTKVRINTPTPTHEVKGMVPAENFPTANVPFNGNVKVNFGKIPLAEGEEWTHAENLENLRHAMCDFLISLLATKNIVKTREVDKLAKLGIGRKSSRGHKHRYLYTTTLRLPRPEDMEDDHEHKPTGLHRAPHLRRGHIRNQHYGPGNKFVKQIFIQPIFVNADADFVSKREAYNVGLGRAHVIDAPQEQANERANTESEQAGSEPGGVHHP